MKRPSDLLRKRPLLALGIQAVPAIVRADDFSRARDVWRACFGQLASGGLISRSSGYPMGLTAHFLIRSVERDPRAESALSVKGLHRAMLEDYRPPFDVTFTAFAVDVARWASAVGYGVSGDEMRGARWRKPIMDDEALASYVEAMAAFAT